MDEVDKQRLADDHQFYLSGRALGFDGKYHIATASQKTWSMDLFVYDPATNTLQERGEIVPGLGGEVRPLMAGPDCATTPAAAWAGMTRRRRR